MEISDLTTPTGPTAGSVTYLAGVGARYLDPEEAGRSITITQQMRWANTTALLRDNGSGGTPFGPAGGSWTMSTLLGFTMLTFAEPASFTWTNAAANGIAPHYSMSHLYLETLTYPPPPCVGSDATMNVRQIRYTKSTQWVVAKPYHLNCSGNECFQLPTLPSGWPRQGTGSHKRDGFEQRVGSGITCTNNSQCDGTLGETCVDADQGGTGGLVCAIVTGTNPPNGTTNTVRRYNWFVRSYRLAAAATFNFDNWAFDDNVLYRTHQSTNEWDFSN
jgi:hypothetical protein